MLLSDRQLPRRQARQPRPERVRRPEGRRARGADRVRVVAAGDAGWFSRRPRRRHADRRRSRSARRSFRFCSPTAAGRTPTTSPKRCATRARICRRSLIVGTLDGRRDLPAGEHRVSAHARARRSRGDARRRRPTPRAVDGRRLASGSSPPRSRYRRSASSISPCWRRRACTTPWRPTARSFPRWPGCIRASARPARPSSCNQSWAIVLALTGEYGDLLDTVVFADWIFFGLTVAGLFVLRPRIGRSRRLPDAGISVAAGLLRPRRRRSSSSARSARAPCGQSIGAGAPAARHPVYYFFKYIAAGVEHASEAPLAPYLLWAKTRRPAAIDLAGSNLLALHARRSAGRSRGRRHLARRTTTAIAPLVEAIAAHYGISPTRIVTATGCSGANFIADRRRSSRAGDDVLVERPGVRSARSARAG